MRRQTVVEVTKPLADYEIILRSELLTFLQIDQHANVNQVHAVFWDRHWDNGGKWGQEWKTNIRTKHVICVLDKKVC